MNTKPWPMRSYQPGDKTIFIYDLNADVDVDDVTEQEFIEQQYKAKLASNAPVLYDAVQYLIEHGNFEAVDTTDVEELLYKLKDNK